MPSDRPAPRRARHTRRTRRAGARAGRLSVVAVLTTALVAVALVGLPRPSDAGGPVPAELLERARGSTDVAYTATAVSFGSLGLPDLPRLGSLTALLGSTTRTRVMWAAPDRHRVDELLSTGERGTYVDGEDVTRWDYGRGRLTVPAPDEPAGAPARLPRPEDLLPPQLLRGLLAGTPPGELADSAAALGGRRVAGRPAQGLRLPSTDARSTLAHADVWVDDATGLPTQVALVDTAGTTALLARFDSLRVGAPDPEALRPPSAPGAERAWARDDLVALADEFAPWEMPDTLAGYPALRGPLDATDVAERRYRADDPLEAGDSPGVQVYGAGLTRLAVLPLRPDVGAQAVEVARTSGGTELDAGGALPASGDAVLLAAGAVRLVMVRSPPAADALPGLDRIDRGPRSYLLAGDVDPAVLDAAVAELVTDPPDRQWQR